MHLLIWCLKWKLSKKSDIIIHYSVSEILFLNRGVGNYFYLRVIRAVWKWMQVIVIPQCRDLQTISVYHTKPEMSLHWPRTFLWQVTMVCSDTFPYKAHTRNLLLMKEPKSCMVDLKLFWWLLKVKFDICLYFKAFLCMYQRFNRYSSSRCDCQHFCF
jgi:hypothetical protein